MNSAFRPTGTSAAPESLTPLVLKVCRWCEPDSKPVYVDVKPAEHAEKLRCYINCFTHQCAFGGKTVFGWCVWESEEMVDAEWHTVWQDTDGNLVDITPHEKGNERILFVPQSVQQPPIYLPANKPIPKNLRGKMFLKRIPQLKRQCARMERESKGRYPNPFAVDGHKLGTYQQVEREWNKFMADPEQSKSWKLEPVPLPVNFYGD